ncbi:GGDEF domain-containing protein [Desulfonatronovibrio magnus]|uniref:GGDEF domain-containing protein n=1 Tax=Desulfonatronovibrio magnus TaxID=698827 RepID=UPI000696E3E5|nr:diguanylate cyclase [Desulfonatronovibrio magnus]
MRGAPKKKKINGWDKISNYLLKILKPYDWTLSFRFIVIPAVFLFLVVLITSLFFARSIHMSSQEHLTERLHLGHSLLNNQFRENFRFIDFSAARIAENPDVIQAFSSRDLSLINDLLKQSTDPIRQLPGFNSLDFCIYLDLDHEGPLSGWECTVRNEVIAPFVEKTWKSRDGNSEIYVGSMGLSRITLVPVIQDMKTAGVFGIRISLNSILFNLDLPRGMTMVPVVSDEFAANLNPALISMDYAGWIAYDSSHAFTLLPSASIDSNCRLSLERNNSFLLYPLMNSSGNELGGVILGIDHSLITSHNQAYWRYITIISLCFGLAIILTLFINLLKIKQFFQKLKRMVIASHSNDFSDRFETDPVHCLEVLNCHNEECPVYENPALVCYLETGSEAISPRWRDTCIFLNKYEDCTNCPVYAMRRGDELDEMRNVINTMMRLWSIFLDKSGRLLSKVLRTESTTYHIPSLDDVANRMEQMANLTSFSHDIRGVYQKEEVYEQLKIAFSKTFKIDHFLLFEVNSSQNRMSPVLDSHPDDVLCKKDIILNPEICRAKRMSEEVSSAGNEALCPYFNCDHSRHIRYCIPLVMGGQVGTVFSFMVPRSEWNMRREQVVVLRKYMEETAPILTTLRLLEVTREQSMRDPLTHCQNRRFLDEYMQQYEPLCIRENKTIGFLMADLDYFKQVNDHHGHQAGDMMLKQVVSIIKEGIRSSDLLIRYGGEEFLILLPQVEPDMSEAVAEKIRAKIEQYEFDIGDGKRIKKTISLGVAEFPHDADSMYKAIKFSDVALYEAKKKGRNRVIRFKREMWTDEDY